jgi:hypothetical protein
MREAGVIDERIELEKPDQEFIKLIVITCADLNTYSCSQQ